MQIQVLLDPYGKHKNVHGKIHQPPVNFILCYNQFKQWKMKHSVEEAANFALIKDDTYMRCLGYFSKNYIDYHLQYDQWMLLWKFIISENNQSMSMERVFRIRKLIQKDVCSGFDCEGLTHRLRIHHNSATPSSEDSVMLYLISWKYWDQQTVQRGRRHSPIAPHISLPK
eukprot:180846_1